MFFFWKLQKINKIFIRNFFWFIVYIAFLAFIIIAANVAPCLFDLKAISQYPSES